MMTRHLAFLATVLSVTALGPLALAQVPNPGAKSAVSGLPIVASFSRSASQSQLDEEMIAPFQVASSTPFQPAPSVSFHGSPNYSISAIFGANAHRIEIDGQDIGAANLPSFDLDKRVLKVNAERRWVSVSASFSRDTIGTPGSNIRRRVNASGVRNDPSGDVHTVYLHGSLGIHPFLPEESFIARTAESIGLGGAHNQTSLDALDYNMGIVTHSANVPGTTVFFQGMDAWHYYFTLTPASCARFSASEPLFGNHVPDPATIYHVVWDGTQWGPIEVYRTARQLGLDPAGDDVDAIAIDRRKGIIIFSTQPVAGRSQLLIHAGRREFGRYYNGTFEDEAGPVAPRFDIVDGAVNPDSGHNFTNDNIETVCIVDPEASDITQFLGTWRDRTDWAVFEPEPMGVTLSRYKDPVTGDYWVNLNVNGGFGSIPYVAPGDELGTVLVYLCLNYNELQKWDQNYWEPVPLVLPRNLGDISLDHAFNFGQQPLGQKLGVLAVFTPLVDPGKTYGSYVAQIGY